ncbi:hypothetical protein ABZU75_23920 [Streptosporangium sp. NPDC005286]|uniref:hypothetical protein n=1 Tax=Streptosporangium sp. NPDC005286 TaxID=3154463 RepID=UPI0033B7D430
MSGKFNAVLQTAAIALFLILRVASGGWLVVIFIFTVIGPVILFTHLVTAFVAARQAALSPLASWGWGLTAFFLLLVGLVLPDFGDSSGGWVPLLALTGGEKVYGTALNVFSWVGLIGIVGYLASLIVAWASISHGRPAAAGGR